MSGFIISSVNSDKVFTKCFVEISTENCHNPGRTTNYDSLSYRGRTLYDPVRVWKPITICSCGAKRRNQRNKHFRLLRHNKFSALRSPTVMFFRYVMSKTLLCRDYTVLACLPSFCGFTLYLYNFYFKVIDWKT